jgi:hypothetical protein
MDDSANEKRSAFDYLVKDLAVQKVLDSDEIVFVEGSSCYNNENFLNEDEREDDEQE